MIKFPSLRTTQQNREMEAISLSILLCVQIIRKHGRVILILTGSNKQAKARSNVFIALRAAIPVCQLCYYRTSACGFPLSALD